MSQAPFLLFLLILALIGLELALRRRATAPTGAWETRPLPPPDPEAVRIVALGDSITFAWELDEQDAWPSQLADRIREAHPHRPWQIINAGVNGHTVADGYARFHEHVRRYHPHLVLIAFGINDCRQVGRMNDARRQALFARNEQKWWGRSYLGRAIANRLSPLPAPDLEAESRPASGPRVPLETYRLILAWLALATRRRGAQPVLLTLAPLSPDLPLTAEREFARWPDYNAAIRELARNLDVPFIEISHKLPGEQPWLADGVHLSAAGEATVADRVWNALQRPTLAPALRLNTRESNAEMAPALE